MNKKTRLSTVFETTSNQCYKAPTTNRQKHSTINCFFFFVFDPFCCFVLNTTEASFASETEHHRSGIDTYNKIAYSSYFGIDAEIRKHNTLRVTQSIDFVEAVYIKAQMFRQRPFSLTSCYASVHLIKTCELFNCLQVVCTRDSFIRLR